MPFFFSCTLETWNTCVRVRWLFAVFIFKNIYYGPLTITNAICDCWTVAMPENFVIMQEEKLDALKHIFFSCNLQIWW